jgi:hypothetical protein
MCNSEFSTNVAMTHCPAGSLGHSSSSAAELAPGTDDDSGVIYVDPVDEVRAFSCTTNKTAVKQLCINKTNH